MPIYTGKEQADGAVRIGPPGEKITGTVAPDVMGAVEHWRRVAETRETALYFAVYLGRAWVGQIVLHDIDLDTGESLIACHLFDPAFRGKGVGSRALRLLVDWVMMETTLRRLVIITSKDNAASRQVAERNGFERIGPSREDPEGEVVYTLEFARY